MTLRVWHVDVRPSGDAALVDGIRSAVRSLCDALEMCGADVDVDVVETMTSAASLARHVSRRRSRAADVVHLHSLFRPAHDVLAAVARQRGVATVVSPHSALAAPALARQPRRKAAWLQTAGRSLLGSASAVCCLSPQEAAEVRVVAPSARTWIVRNPLPRSVIDAASWSVDASDPRLLLTLGRWDVRQKGLDRLSAIAVVAPNLRVDVHGAQDKNEPLATEALRRTAPTNFHLRPPVYGDDKLDRLRRARLYVVPSRWEGLSMSLLEALALGVPVAVSSYVARTLPVADADLGLVLDDDPAVAARQLQAAAQDEATLTRWSRAGRAWCFEHCAPAAVGVGLGALYTDVANAPQLVSADEPGKALRAPESAADGGAHGCSLTAGGDGGVRPEPEPGAAGAAVRLPE